MNVTKKFVSLRDTVKNEFVGIVDEAKFNAEEFKESIKGLSEKELTEMGKSLQKGSEMFIDFSEIVSGSGSESEATREKMLILSVRNEESNVNESNER